MAVQYTNRKIKIYYLHQGETKTGKPRYFFSTDKKESLVEEMPEGYEIYEHPTNAQVFLRKKKPQIITDSEKSVVEEGLKELTDSAHYIVEVKRELLSCLPRIRMLISF